MLKCYRFESAIAYYYNPQDHEDILNRRTLRLSDRAEALTFILFPLLPFFPSP